MAAEDVNTNNPIYVEETKISLQTLFVILEQ